jgi:hypothetical protein
MCRALRVHPQEVLHNGTSYITCVMSVGRTRSGAARGLNTVQQTTVGRQN